MGNIEKFDGMASRYDTDERAETAKIIAEAIRAHVVNGNEKTAIDYGCGTGLVGMELLDAFRSMLLVDASKNMVLEVEQKLANLRVQNARALCCDFMEEEVPSIQADYIIMAQTLLHIDDVELALSRLYRALHEGGHLLIVDFDKNEAVVSDKVHNGFVQKELIAAVEKAGFIDAEAKTFYHGDRMFMNEDASLFILDCVKPFV